MLKKFKLENNKFKIKKSYFYKFFFLEILFVDKSLETLVF